MASWTPTPLPHNRDTPSGFHVEYEIKDSAVAFGKGLFAKHFVPKGTLLWKYQSGARGEANTNVWMYKSEDEARARLGEVSKAEAEYIMDHVYMFEGRLNEILDDGKMWNHSETPNTGLPPTGEGYCWESTYAIRDIQAGEEFLVSVCVFSLAVLVLSACVSLLLCDIFAPFSPPPFPIPHARRMTTASTSTPSGTTACALRTACPGTL